MTQGRSEQPERPFSFPAFYKRFGSWMWLVAMLLILVTIWQLDEPAGSGQTFYGRVLAAEQRGEAYRLTVEIADSTASVESKVPYRSGDRVKLRKRTTLIFKRTVYEMSSERG